MVPGMADLTDRSEMDRDGERPPGATLTDAALGYTQENYLLRIQVTDMAGGTATIEHLGAGGVWDPVSDVTFSEGETAVLTARFPQVRVNFSGTGNAHVTAYRP